ncbi:glycogen debranching protein [Leptolyngbya sp. 'hensonii']|uniref:glycogen debranching protein n=1 Tax=Leptolyngbya sp. 'hensonii' TaxID=1922337 RepID=UPI0009501A1A|nr:glycogen debranching protein [Leptolyngbya sp. 'hensonii']OLP15814.1 glycogen debranching protein [Leptolyngbya sp. 'hensonii']
MAIWVNEQIDPSGILYSCIACYDEDQANDCHASFEQNLTEDQKKEGWVARIRKVESWDEVPASALKLD